MIERVKTTLVRKARLVSVVVARTIREFSKNRGTLLAAAISYHLLLSLFPLAIVLVASAGLILRDSSLRERAVDEVVNLVSLDEGGTEQVAGVLDSIASGESTVGFVALLGLIWSASAVMSAVRRSFATIWGQEPRPFLRAKLLDVGLVFGVGVLVALSLGLTLTTQAVRRLSASAEDEIGPLGAGADFFGWASGTAAPILLSFAVFTVAYTVIPSVRQPFRDIWPGALLAALAFEGFKVGFSFYLANFASYNVVYGSLGAVIAFMVFVYLSSIMLLVCAELVSELGIARMEAAQDKEPSVPVPLRDRTKRALQRLVVRDESAGRDQGDDTAVADSAREQAPADESSTRPAD